MCARESKTASRVCNLGNIADSSPNSYRLFSQSNYPVGRVERQRHGNGLGAEERHAGMVFRMAEVANIENPREYASQEVEDLRDLLLAGGEVERDPRRKHFYNLEGDKSAFYIHISPITGNVMLLAKWSRQPSDCYVAAEHLVS
jgi:hypothetical protein